MRHLGSLFLLIAASCGGGGSADGGGGAPGPGPAPQPQTVSESLSALGVSLASGPRVGADGNALPKDWMPLGPAYRVNRLDELFVINGNAGNVFEGRFQELKDFSFEPWSPSYLQRATASGDFDGDGREEVLIVASDPDGLRVDAYLHGDAKSGYASLASGMIAATVDDVGRLQAVAGDFDGDGDVEAAVAWVSADGAGDFAEIVFVDYAGGALARIGRTIQFAPTTGSLFVSLAAGQIDADPAEEIVYVVNEYFDRDLSVLSRVLWRNAITRYAILDDAATDFEEIVGGTVGANVGGVLRTAKSSCAALADIDADGLDEVVLGGLTNIGRPDESANTTMGYLLYALDDAAHGFAELGARFQAYSNPNTQDAAASQWLEYVPVDAADLDGDTTPEIRIAHLLNWWVDGAWVPAGTLPFAEVMFPDAVRTVVVSQRNTRSAVGRIVAGTRDNILTWSRDLDTNLRVWGLVGGAPVREDMRSFDSVDCLQTADLDADTLVLEYVPGSHDLVFTEPVILAVLAAAPGGEGQDPDDCRTQFGIADSSGAETETALSMTAGVVVGVAAEANLPGFALGLEETFTITETVERTTSTAYEVTQTVVWETGPIEDSVIFTSIPYDQYRYRVLEPGANEKLRDREVLVSIPRRPVQLMASREFYDSHVVEGAPTVGEVLPHTEGDPSSYYTLSQAMGLVDAHGGIASDPQDVGEGSGNVSVTLEVGEAYTEGASITAAWSGDIRATAGVIAGVTVGESRTDALRLTTGRKLIYGGTVGQIDAAHFDRNAYSFGIFAYPRRDEASDRAYQVVNYWVTPLR